ncbi:hypothetical protein BGX33_012409 [Mortierella sp. NVP41]|nr:hypothetical protein BGX33_012409 [Mortierella sp. NVP41]
MVLSEIWTLAFGAQNSLPDQDDSDLAAHHYHGDNNDNTDNDDSQDSQQAAIAKILGRQRVLVDAERDILGTTVYLPVPNVRDEAAENKSGFILVVTSLTLNNIGCYPFFGIRDRHQVFPKLFPEISPRSSVQYLQQVYRSQGVLGIWYGMPCSMICHTCTIFYEAFLNSIIRRLRRQSRKILPKPLIYLSTRVVEFLLYIPLYPLLRNSLLLRMDSRTGPWPGNASYLYLLRSFFVDYVHDLIGLFYSRGRSPSILPLYSTVLPSYVLNLLFEIIQTWIFRWIYPRLVPASFFSRKRASRSASAMHPPQHPPPLLSAAMPRGSPSSSSSTNGTSPTRTSASRRNGSRQQRQQQNQQQQNQQAVTDGSMTAVTATEISATIMAAMPSVSSSSPTTTTLAVNRARRGLRYLSTVSPRNPTLLQEFYPEMVCAMTSSMITRVLLYPLDTVACRVSAQGGSFPGIGVAPTPYSGFWDCWTRSLRSEGGGLWGLYSGVVDCIIVEAMAAAAAPPTIPAAAVEPAEEFPLVKLEVKLGVRLGRLEVKLDVKLGVRLGRLELDCNCCSCWFLSANSAGPVPGKQAGAVGSAGIGSTAFDTKGDNGDNGDRIEGETVEALELPNPESCGDDDDKELKEEKAVWDEALCLDFVFLLSLQAIKKKVMVL